MRGFSRTHARRSDPRTSHLAAQTALPLSIAHCTLIGSYLRSIQPLDATADEIAEATGLMRHAVLKRLPELQRDRLAEPTGAIRQMSSGKMGRVWRAIP